MSGTTRFDCYCLNLILICNVPDMGWILSRKPQISQQNLNMVNGIVAFNGLKLSQFTTTIQDCGILN